MALFAQKTMQFVRAPDENVFIARKSAILRPIRGSTKPIHMIMPIYLSHLVPNTFSPAFNLIEIFLLIFPFEWWLSTARYERLNNFVMGILYSPLLLITAFLETREARHVKYNRQHGESDEDRVEEWEQMDGVIDPEEEGWARKVDSTRPNVETDAAVLEIREVMEVLKILGERVVAIQAKVEGMGK